MVKEMQLLEKIFDWCLYLLIGFGTFGLCYGIYQTVNLIFIR